MVFGRLGILKAFPTLGQFQLMMGLLGPTFFFFLNFFRATIMAYGVSQARGPVRATDASLHHSHSDAGSELHLHPTQQPTATPDP